MLFILKDFVTTRYCKSKGNKSRLQYTILISEEQDIQQCHHDNERNHSSAVLQHPVQQQVVFNYRNVCNSESLLYDTKFVWTTSLKPFVNFPMAPYNVRKPW